MRSKDEAKAYRQTEQGRAAVKKYNQSPSARAARKRYELKHRDKLRVKRSIAKGGDHYAERILAEIGDLDKFSGGVYVSKIPPVKKRAVYKKGNKLAKAFKPLIVSRSPVIVQCVLCKQWKPAACIGVDECRECDSQRG